MFLVPPECLLNSSPGGHFTVFFNLSCGIFLCFLRTVWFLLKICKNILGIIVAIAQKIIWHIAFILQGYFELR